MTIENEVLLTRPKSQEDIPADRKCLRCLTTFPSEGFGQRICTRCKNSSAWRTAAPTAFSVGRRH